MYEAWNDVFNQSKDLSRFAYQAYSKSRRLSFLAQRFGVMAGYLYELPEKEVATKLADPVE